MRALSALGCLILVSCGGSGPRPVAEARPRASASAPEKIEACVDVETCKNACDAGQFAACDDWWERVRARPLGTSPKEAVLRLDRACKAGRGQACQDLATVVTMSPELPADPARGQALLARACELGRHVSCLETDRALFGDEGEAPTQEALARKRAALTELVGRCEAHDGTACAVSSVLFMALEHDLDKSRRYAIVAGDELEASCLSGHALDCERAAMQIGASASPQPARARRLFERGCAEGLGGACTQAAKLSEGSPREIVAKLDDACAKGDADGCFERARLTSAAEVGPVVKSGMALARAGCALGESLGCDAIVKGLSLDATPADEARELVALVERVCDRGVGPTCGGLARLLVEGPPSLRDPARAKPLRVRACDLDYPFACHDPFALLGAYPRLDLPVLDVASGVEWAPPAPKLVTPAEAKGLCAARAYAHDDWRLPTRAELSTLAESDDGLRPFASATSPERDELFSSEAASADEAVAMSVRHGSFATAKKGRVRCVREARKRPKGAAREAPLELLTLTMKGVDLAYVLTTRGKETLSARVPGDPDKNRSFQLVWDGANHPGPVDVVVDPAVSWSSALRFVEIAMKDGLHVRRLVVPNTR